MKLFWILVFGVLLAAACDEKSPLETAREAAAHNVDEESRAIATCQEKCAIHNLVYEGINIDFVHVPLRSITCRCGVAKESCTLKRN